MGRPVFNQICYDFLHPSVGTVTLQRKQTDSVKKKQTNNANKVLFILIYFGEILGRVTICLFCNYLSGGLPSLCHCQIEKKNLNEYKKH